MDSACGLASAACFTCCESIIWPCATTTTGKSNSTCCCCSCDCWPQICGSSLDTSKDRYAANTQQGTPDTSARPNEVPPSYPASQGMSVPPPSWKRLHRSYDFKLGCLNFNFRFSDYPLISETICLIHRPMLLRNICSFHIVLLSNQLQTPWSSFVLLYV